MAIKKSKMSLQAKKKERKSRNKKLDELLEELEELHRDAHDGYGRFGFYDYLHGVYRGPDRIAGIEKALADKMKSKYRSNHSPFHALIALTSDRDTRTRSKWAIALRRCATAHVPHQKVREFLRVQGGPNKFASQKLTYWEVKRLYERFRK